MIQYVELSDHTMAITLSTGPVTISRSNIYNYEIISQQIKSGIDETLLDIKFIDDNYKISLYSCDNQLLDPTSDTIPYNAKLVSIYPSLSELAKYYPEALI